MNNDILFIFILGKYTKQKNNKKRIYPSRNKDIPGIICKREEQNIRKMYNSVYPDIISCILPLFQPLKSLFQFLYKIFKTFRNNFLCCF